MERKAGRKTKQDDLQTALQGRDCDLKQSNQGRRSSKKETAEPNFIPRLQK